MCRFRKIMSFKCAEERIVRKKCYTNIKMDLDQKEICTCQTIEIIEIDVTVWYCIKEAGKIFLDRK